MLCLSFLFTWGEGVGVIRLVVPPLSMLVLHLLVLLDRCGLQGLDSFIGDERKMAVEHLERFCHF